jgi:hypothetical protein
MATPADLVAHYSELAFKTRTAALAFVGAALGAEIAWKHSQLLGVALLVIVASLAELNHRYTWSYLSACRASALNDTPDLQRQWQAFIEMNEGPWNPLRKDQPAPLPAKRFVKRFLLSWSTYLPGLIAGTFLIMRDGTAMDVGLALAAGVLLLGWWGRHVKRQRDPKDFMKEPR